MGRRAAREGHGVRITRGPGILLVGLVLLAMGCGRATIAVGGWIASCHDVSLTDCNGVAQLFVENLAAREADYRSASGGELAVDPRPACAVRGAPRSGPWVCWQASARVPGGRVCMVFGQYAGGGTLAQVGGHDVRGVLRGSVADRPACL